MTYELALKLKEAGWVQELKAWDGFYLTKGDNKGELQIVSGYKTDSGAYGPYVGKDCLFLGWGDRPSEVEGVEKGTGSYDFRDGDYVNFGSDYYCKAPTLEELIEACGEKLDFVKRGGEDVFSKLLDKEGISTDWVAGTRDIKLLRFGSTPSEAVARLWLSLNKK